MKHRVLLTITCLLLLGRAAVADVLRFDGSDDRVVVPNQAQLNLGAGDFTIEMGVQSSATNTLSILLSKRTADADGFIFGIWNDGRLYAQLGGVPNLLASTTSPNLYNGQCHRVALTHTGPLVTFYVDGREAGTTTSNRSISSTGPLHIGYDAPARLSFSGQTGEVRL